MIIRYKINLDFIQIFYRILIVRICTKIQDSFWIQTLLFMNATFKRQIDIYVGTFTDVLIFFVFKTRFPSCRHEIRLN